MNLKRILRRPRAPEALAGVIALLLLGLLFRVHLIEFSEDVAYQLDPSGQRAFSYGERHFRASDANAYDIDRAERFFYLAAAQDPTIPYLYHELARVSFLRGNFDRALSQINFQIRMQGEKTPNSYYIRALIEGYKGDYDASAQDYEHYLANDPSNWAALNDYAWVLLKADRPAEAAAATARGLAFFPDNPWLLNSSATALFELGRYGEALAQAKKAGVAVEGLSEEQWLTAYPGNDPNIAGGGIAAFKKAVLDNIHSITTKIASSTVQ